MLFLKSLLAVALAAVAVQAAVIERATTTSACTEVHPTASKVKEIKPNFERTNLKSDNKVTLDRFISSDETTVSRKVRYQSSGKPEYIEIETEKNKKSLVEVKFMTKEDKEVVRYFKLTSEHTCIYTPPKADIKKIVDVSYYSVSN